MTSLVDASTISASSCANMRRNVVTGCVINLCPQTFGPQYLVRRVLPWTGSHNKDLVLDRVQQEIQVASLYCLQAVQPECAVFITGFPWGRKV